MIPLEGRLLSGLDEFMLRLGHLKFLCAVGVDVGSSWFRIEREAANRLVQPQEVPDGRIATVAEYLKPVLLACAFVAHRILYATVRRRNRLSCRN